MILEDKKSRKFVLNCAEAPGNGEDELKEEIDEYDNSESRTLV